MNNNLNFGTVFKAWSETGSTNFEANVLISTQESIPFRQRTIVQKCSVPFAERKSEQVQNFTQDNNKCKIFPS